MYTRTKYKCLSRCVTMSRQTVYLSADQNVNSLWQRCGVQDQRADESHIYSVISLWCATLYKYLTVHMSCIQSTFIGAIILGFFILKNVFGWSNTKWVKQIRLTNEFWNNFLWMRPNLAEDLEWSNSIVFTFSLKQSEP